MIIDCTREAYDRIDAANFSTLSSFEHSPLAYKMRMETPREATDAMTLGRLIHSLTFEPEKVDREWVVWDGGRRFGKEWDAFQVEHAGKSILRAQDLDPAVAISAAVRAHPVAAQWLERGDAELTLRWTDAETGIECKSRADWRTNGMLVDLKSTKDCSARAMSASVLRYRYHAQAAMYLDGLAACGGDENTFALICVQKPATLEAASPPPKVRCYTLSEGAIEVGRITYRKWLRALAECRARDEWPAWLPGEDSVSELDLPAYAYDADDTFALEDAS